jgi:adenylate cyclase
MADNPPVQRRLAAILAADVAGYSRLMGADEVGTLRRLKALLADLIERELSLSSPRLAIGEGT